MSNTPHQPVSTRKYVLTALIAGGCLVAFIFMYRDLEGQRRGRRAVRRYLIVDLAAADAWRRGHRVRVEVSGRAYALPAVFAVEASWRADLAAMTITTDDHTHALRCEPQVALHQIAVRRFSSDAVGALAPPDRFDTVEVDRLWIGPDTDYKLTTPRVELNNETAELLRSKPPLNE